MYQIASIFRFATIFLALLLASTNGSIFKLQSLKLKNDSENELQESTFAANAQEVPIDEAEQVDSCGRIGYFTDNCRICPSGHYMSLVSLRNLQKAIRKQNIIHEMVRNPKCHRCDFPIIISPTELYFVVSGMLLGMTSRNLLDTNDNNPLYRYILKQGHVPEARKWKAIKGHIKFFRFTGEFRNEKDWVDLYVQLLTDEPDLEKLNKLFNLNVLRSTLRFPKHVPQLQKAIGACGTDPNYAQLKVILEAHLWNSRHGICFLS